MSLACPACRSPLPRSDASPCAGCGRDWASRYGLLDLRPQPHDDPADADLVEEIASASPAASYVDLVARVFAFRRAQRSSAGRDGDRGFERFRDRVEDSWLTTFERRGAVHRQLLEGMVTGIGGAHHVDRLVDVGCGWGRDLLHLSGLAERAYGVDSSPLSLLLTRRLLEERGVRNVELVLAEAEALPFADGALDAVNSSACIEHLHRPADLLTEAGRCLRSRGWAFLYYPNRWSALPEGHTGMLGLGWLPRALQDRMVRRRYRRDWEVTLLSRRRFLRLVDESFPMAACHVTGLPEHLGEFASSSWLGTGGRRALAGASARLAMSIPGVEQLGTAVSPVHFAALLRT